MGFEFSNDIPIFLQIIEYVKIQIITGKYISGEKIPSVRDLSVLFGVNPNTVQKALVELEKTGLIFTESTNGKYVTQNTHKIKEVTIEMVNEKLTNFVDEMESLGITKKDIIEMLKK